MRRLFSYLFLNDPPTSCRLISLVSPPCCYTVAPCQGIDPPNRAPEQPPCEMALGRHPPVVPRMLHQPAAVFTNHSRDTATASATTSSTSRRYSRSNSSVSASYRITSTGWVLDALTKPHPRGKRTRTPSTSRVLCRARNCSVARRTTANLSRRGNRSGSPA